MANIPAVLVGLALTGAAYGFGAASAHAADAAPRAGIAASVSAYGTPAQR